MQTVFMRRIWKECRRVIYRRKHPLPAHLQAQSAIMGKQDQVGAFLISPLPVVDVCSVFEGGFVTEM